MITRSSHRNACRHYSVCVPTVVAAAALALVLAGCAYTPQNPDTGTSVAGQPAGGEGGTGGGSAAGQNTGTASGGASGGVSTLPSPALPEVVGTPSAPAPGSQANPAPSTSARGTTGLPADSFDRTATSARTSPGPTAEGNPDNRDTAEARGPDGTAGADARARAADATDQAGTENAQTGNATGEGSAETGQRAGEAGAGTGEIGQSAGEADAGASSATTPGGGLESGDRGDLESLDSGLAALPGASGSTAEGQPGAGGYGAMTSAERRAAIRARIDASFAAMNGLALSERERVQAAANAARLAGERLESGISGAVRREIGGGGEGTGERPAAINSNIGGTGGATMPTGGTTQPGDFNGAAASASYAIPADIPSGDDDDVVARQLREAAVREANPELREKLWDEYRAYTGLNR